MNNNDILRRLRYTFNFKEEKIVKLFSIVGENITKEDVSAWLKDEEEPGYMEIN